VVQDCIPTSGSKRLLQEATRTLYHPTNFITTVAVNITSADGTLNLNTDESYDLIVAAPTSVITGATVFSGLRALETFAQLVECVRFDDNEKLVHPMLAPHAVFSGNPKGRHAAYELRLVSEVVIRDAPRFAHRGLLIDTARHFLPISLIKVSLVVAIHGAVPFAAKSAHPSSAVACVFCRAIWMQWKSTK
jgi:hypothetical protein